ncbi:hypothetical protein PSPO01_14777 [Paraphaeosphaeria sporulosa]
MDLTQKLSFNSLSACINEVMLLLEPTDCARTEPTAVPLRFSRTTGTPSVRRVDSTGSTTGKRHSGYYENIPQPRTGLDDAQMQDVLDVIPRLHPSVQEKYMNRILASLGMPII